MLDRLKFSSSYKSYYTYTEDSNPILMLPRAVKARKFFESQVGLDDTLLRIPRWYHTTGFSKVESIIKDKQIDVRKENNSYEGAWVSTQREAPMARHNGTPSTFVFTHHITQIDPQVKIETEKGKTLWRGLQHSISLKNEKNIPHLVLISLDKKNYKDHKMKVMNDLKTQGIHNVTICSNEQLEYMQKEFTCALGNPNLTDLWWGKANVQYVDNPLLKYQ